MKKITMLSNTEYTVHRPIITSVINDLKERFFHDPELYVDYLDNNTNNEFTTTGNIKTHNKTHHSFLEVNSSIVTNDDNIMANPVLQNVRRPILLDRDIIFDVSMNTINTIFTLKLKFYDKNKDNLVKKVNQVKISMVTDNFYDQHRVEYYYTIPIPLLALIRNITDLKIGKEESYYKYIESISKVNIDYLNSKGGEYKIPIVREIQPVLGNLETDLANVDIENDNKGFYIELDYLLEIETPTFLIIDYPIMVFNKTIDTQFIPEDNLIELVENADNLVAALYNQIGFSIHDEIRNGEALIRYPGYDDMEFKIPQKPGMLRLVSILLRVDPDNLNFITSLDNLRDLFFNDSLIDFFRLYKDRTLFNPLRNAFHFELFENDYIVDYKMRIDENDNIVTSTPLDIKKTYRLVLNGLYDFNFLVNKDKLSSDGLAEYFEKIENINIRTTNNLETAFYTVMLSYIIANNEGD